MNNDIKDAIKNNSLVLFVGAGMSIPFGFPNWTKLILNILKQLKEESNGNSPINFQFYINQGNNLDVFEVLNTLENNKYRTRVKEILYTEIDKINIKDKDFSKQEKLWQISDKIITTNYDNVLEKKIPEQTKPFKNFNEFQQSKSLNGGSFLYKIHGDIINPDTCILFESDYKKIYNKDSSDRETLKSFLQTKTLLFLGFSFEDPFIQKQLDYLCKIYKGYNSRHYIVLTNNKDLREYNINTLPIKDWGEGFHKFLDELIEIKKEYSNTTDITTTNTKEDIDISKIEDLQLLEELLNEKKKEFETTEETKKIEVSKNMQSIQNRMLELFTKKIGLNFRQNIPEHKEAKLELLFQTIFKSEKLPQQTIDKIHHVRNQNEKSYQWYQRSVIVSALACSLINHKKLDVNKINLLIDFTNDSEDKVWQKAITYLFLILNHLGNKWIKFQPLKIKLETLKTQDRIQNALRTVITAMQMEVQNVSPVNEKIFENDYFKDNPFNYFLPFYENNPSLEKIYDDNSIKDIEDYVDAIHKSPLPDSFKYLLCNSKTLKKQNDTESKEDKDRYLSYVLDIHFALEPYLNYINELLNFYKNSTNIDVILKQKTTVIGFNNFKKHLLNASEHHRAMARQFMFQKDYGKATIQVEQLLIIKHDDKEALLNLAICYHNTKKNINTILKLRLKIEEIVPENHENLNEIGDIFYDKKKYKKSIHYIDKAIELDYENSEYYNNRAINKDCLKNYSEAIKDFNKAIELDNKDDTLYNNRGVTKNNLKNFNEAIKDFNKAIELNNKDAKYYNNRGNSESNLKNYNKAIKDYNKAIKLDNKYADIFFNRGIANDYLKNYDKAIRDYNKAIELIPKNAFFYVKRGISKHDLKRYEEAIIDFNISIELNDKNADFYNSRGKSKLELKRIEEAIIDFEKSIELDDEELAYKNDKANALRIIGDIENALKTINIVIEIEERKKNNEEGWYYGTKAAIYATSGDSEKFYLFLEKALISKAKAFNLNDDIKEKYRNEKRFQELLTKYNQTLDEE